VGLAVGGEAVGDDVGAAVGETVGLAVALDGGGGTGGGGNGGGDGGGGDGGGGGPGGGGNGGGDGGGGEGDVETVASPTGTPKCSGANTAVPLAPLTMGIETAMRGCAALAGCALTACADAGS